MPQKAEFAVYIESCNFFYPSVFLTKATATKRHTTSSRPKSTTKVEEKKNQIFGDPTTNYCIAGRQLWTENFSPNTLQGLKKSKPYCSTQRRTQTPPPSHSPPPHISAYYTTIPPMLCTIVSPPYRPLVFHGVPLGVVEPGEAPPAGPAGGRHLPQEAPAVEGPVSPPPPVRFLGVWEQV